MAYDSLEDTLAHRREVRALLNRIFVELIFRQVHHDDSKLQEPEKSMYDEFKPRIQEAETRYGYGSPEYEHCVRDLGPALEHHFEANRHHPEHFENGINGMTLIDLVEMLCDWKAASMRSGQELNLEANRLRFVIWDQLYEILLNTVRELGW